jgi:hypothetical protein
MDQSSNNILGLSGQKQCQVYFWPDPGAVSVREVLAGNYKVALIDVERFRRCGGPVFGKVSLKISHNFVIIISASEMPS